MDYKELLKKYWFVGVVAIVLLVFVGVYAADAYKNRELTVTAKDVDGKSAVYSVDGEYVLFDKTLGKSRILGNGEYFIYIAILSILYNNI